MLAERESDKDATSAPHPNGSGGKEVVQSKEATMTHKTLGELESSIETASHEDLKRIAESDEIARDPNVSEGSLRYNLRRRVNSLIGEHGRDHKIEVPSSAQQQSEQEADKSEQEAPAPKGGKMPPDEDSDTGDSIPPEEEPQRSRPQTDKGSKKPFVRRWGKTWEEKENMRSGDNTAQNVFIIILSGIIIIGGLIWLFTSDVFGDDDNSVPVGNGEETTPTPSPDNNEDGNNLTSASNSQEAAQLFGGNADNWSEVPGSGNTGWIYEGPPVDISVPSGHRIDYPNHTCAVSGSSGVYGRATVEDQSLATVWHVPDETSCPDTAASNDSNSSGSDNGSKPAQDNSSDPTPSNNNGQPSANSGGNGETVVTSCGETVEWGPAGPAPGAFTDDSAAQVAEAIQVMDIDQEDAQYVTIHKFCAGDDTPNGWVVGSSWTESQRINVEAGFLPAGVCIDYDHNVTQIKGEVYHTEQLNSRWSRTQLMSDGSASGFKFTPYWTPCVFTDGTPSWDGNGAKPNPSQGSNEPEATQEAAFSCSNLPESKEHLTQVFPNTSAESWTQHPQYPHGWIYNGPKVSLQWVEGVHHFDYDGGSTAVGENPPAGSAFTVWFCE